MDKNCTYKDLKSCLLVLIALCILVLNKLLDGYDFFDMNPDPSPYQDDAHGTACAGLAAAETNNGTGVAGVCWNCKIMPIRIASSEYLYWVKEEAAANGITWAANQGADVLSNSWTYTKCRF